MGRKDNPNKPANRGDLVRLLNSLGGPKAVSKKLRVSRITIHNWINDFSIKASHTTVYF